MSEAPNKAEVFAGLPDPWPGDPLLKIRGALASSRRTVVILDDDPTGTQTVRNLNVVTCWDVDTLRTEFESDEPGFFVLTNSRSLTEMETRALHHEIGANLIAAAGNRPFTVISRSDSTLRGHYPAETDTIAEHVGPPDLIVIAPYFEAGGRYTIGDTHYVAERDHLIPASETPFAKDAAFGYSTAHLPSWIEEKTAGKIRAGEVFSVSIEDIRTGGPDAVEDTLYGLPAGTVVVINACCPRDIEVATAALLRLEIVGKSIIYRSAASLVAARVGQAPQPPLDASEFAVDRVKQAGGIIIAGSYVPKTTAQLERLRARYDLEEVEIDVNLLLDPARRQAHLTEVVTSANQAVRSGRDVLAYTSRTLVTGSDAASSLDIGRSVSEALVHLVESLDARPRFLVAKGGITSSDVATRGLGVRRARIVGQILPGVPVWRLGPEARFPDMAYVVFPGNVGDDDAMAEAVTRLRGP